MNASSLAASLLFFSLRVFAASASCRTAAAFAAASAASAAAEACEAAKLARLASASA